MKASALKYGILSVTAAIITIILLLVPFHAFLSIWIANTTGHYTAVRLWKEVLLAVAALGALYLALFDKKVRASTLYHELTWLIIAYATVQLVWAAWALQHHSVSTKAVMYGVLINLRFLLVFMVAWAVGARTKRLTVQWSKLLLWPALVVLAVGLLQAFILPVDFLKHFGYSSATIDPYETINHNSQYIRIMSTLRGANPLGAYLLLPISALLVLMTVGKRNWQRAAMLLAAAIVLFFSFSRAAWLGALLCAAVVVFTQLKRRGKQYAGIGAAMFALLGILMVITLHDNARFQNIFLHTQEHSAVATTSNGGHISALRTGVHDVLHQPLGSGPGSAGPASVYNDHRTRIAENYYVQIAQETGWLGLGLFLAINIFLGWLLWQRRADPLSLTLFASLIGISFVNLLSHAWTDDTLAYVWWGLAGIAIGAATKPAEESSDTKD